MQQRQRPAQCKAVESGLATIEATARRGPDSSPPGQGIEALQSGRRSQQLRICKLGPSIVTGWRVRIQRLGSHWLVSAAACESPPHQQALQTDVSRLNIVVVFEQDLNWKDPPRTAFAMYLFMMSMAAAKRSPCVMTDTNKGIHASDLYNCQCSDQISLCLTAQRRPSSHQPTVCLLSFSSTSLGRSALDGGTRMLLRDNGQRARQPRDHVGTELARIPVVCTALRACAGRGWCGLHSIALESKSSLSMMCSVWRCGVVTPLMPFVWGEAGGKWASWSKSVMVCMLCRGHVSGPACTSSNPDKTLRLHAGRPSQGHCHTRCDTSDAAHKGPAQGCHTFHDSAGWTSNSNRFAATSQQICPDIPSSHHRAEGEREARMTRSAMGLVMAGRRRLQSVVGSSVVGSPQSARTRRPRGMDRRIGDGNGDGRADMRNVL